MPALYIVLSSSFLFAVSVRCHCDSIITGLRMWMNKVEEPPLPFVTTMYQIGLRMQYSLNTSPSIKCKQCLQFSDAGTRRESVEDKVKKRE